MEKGPNYYPVAAARNILEDFESPIEKAPQFYPEKVADRKGREHWVSHVEIATKADAVEVVRMRELGDAWEEELIEHPEWMPPTSSLENPGALDIPQDNKAALWLYEQFMEEADEGSMKAWAANLFPTARALYLLQRTEDGGRLLPGGKIDERAQYLFSTMVDGEGLRNRAEIYARTLSELASKTNENRLKIVSLGCGAGVPNIDATERIEREENKALDWDYYDLDKESLEFSKQLLSESSVQGSTVNFGNGSEVAGRSYARAFALPPESVDAVDALGLWEYVAPKQAIKFAQRAYSLVKPGGKMIISNMLPDRPQREFNQRAVGWPGLYLRSGEDLLDIVEQAGIDTEDVHMIYSQDGVYVVMEINKPA